MVQDFSFLFPFFLQTPKGHHLCYANTFLPISAVLSGCGTVSSFDRLLVCVPMKVSRIFADLIKYLVKFRFFLCVDQQCASSTVWASSSFSSGNLEKHRLDSYTELFTDRQWKTKKDLAKAAMEARRRGKSMQDSVLDSIDLDNSGTKEHTSILKTSQWRDRSCWNSSWMRLNDLSCWQTVGMVTGLTLAGVIGLFHAWYVYSIHENLLWFSQLEVRRTTLKVEEQADLWV